MQNKILILSQSHLESSTDYVCMWLSHLKYPYRRVNGEDLFEMNGLQDLPQDKETAIVWYRRKISSFPAKYSLKVPDFKTEYALKRFLIDEFNNLYSYMFYSLQRNKWLNDPDVENNLTKLGVLALAKSVGLCTPLSEVVTTRKSVEELLQRHGELIVKPLSECIFLEDMEGRLYKMLTKTINSNNVHLIPDKFFPSLIQKKIQKKFEVRTYFLDGDCYSMAIFSQSNKRTQEDFRNYDNLRPNRTVPYKLPEDIEDKLKKLMDKLSFRTGSIDFMVDEKGVYQFLEVNPEGQFGMVSYPCNYYLEKKLAQFLGTKITYEKEI